MGKTKFQPGIKTAPARSLVVSGENLSAIIVKSSCDPYISVRHSPTERPITPAPTTAMRGFKGDELDILIGLVLVGDDTCKIRGGKLMRCLHACSNNCLP